jgi:hypothetical protein
MGLKMPFMCAFSKVRLVSGKALGKAAKLKIKPARFSPQI